MRVAEILLCCCVLLLAAGCSRQEAASTSPSNPDSTTAVSPQPALDPKIVVQFGHQAPVLAVRWVDEGRHLVSLAGDGSIVIWNVASGAILDHAQVPLAETFLIKDRGKPELRLMAFFDGPTADSLAIAYTADKNEVAERACADAYRRGTAWCTYRVDLTTREVHADAALSVPTIDANDAKRHWPLSPDGLLRAEPNHGKGRRGLPDLVDEHFGMLDETCRSVRHCRYGVSLFAVSGNAAPRVFTFDPRGYSLDADLSSDGLRLLRVVNLYRAAITRVESLDLSNGRSVEGFDTKRAYHQARWLDRDRYLLTSEGYNPTNDSEDAMAGFPPARLIDPSCSARDACPEIDSRWQMRSAADGAFVALGPLSQWCFRTGFGGIGCNASEDQVDTGNYSMDPPATGLAWLEAGARNWRPWVVPALKDQVITAIETSPDRRQLAIATRVWDRADAPGAKQVLRLWLMDLGDRQSSPRQLWEINEPLGGNYLGFADGATVRAISFSADGRYLVFTHAAMARTDYGKADLHVIDLDQDGKTRTIPDFSSRATAIGDDRVLGLDDGVLIDVGNGQRIAKLPIRAGLLRAGWIERSRLLWGGSEDGRIMFWDSSDGRSLLTLHALPDNRFFAVTPEGRYDSNLGADSALVRWMVPDAPWRSLAGQTFMRDYYEPGLYRRLLDCRASDTCDQAFKPLPAIASLNRVLPQVRITGIRTGRDASEAVVSVEVREGVDADAPNGKTRSGIFNPRLFRNGRLVAMSPRQVATSDSDPIQWRKRNVVKTDDGVHRLEFTVPLPTQAGQETQVFSAYAFNEDRIKGETVTRVWNRPALTPRPRRAYVLAIGIDDYDTPRFRLNYAVADARLMASRLSSIPGYETRTVVLAAERLADGRRTRVDRATLTQVLSLLAGEGDREATLASLRQAGIDASALQAATPDDAVIVSFSGHGWANPQGDFYLIPGNGRWPEGSESPDLSTVFSTADLVMPFHAMQAGEITLVIDACHSAASVADGRFKPGPMGDSGLGQLAFDKGIRILAATQADDVALEDARLGQGLLTYALAVDGLGEGKADLDAKGGIRIDEWLAYAVQRLPSLANDARVGRISATGSGTRAITFHDLPANAPARRVQQPALFDFNPQPSTVLLREGTR